MKKKQKTNHTTLTIIIVNTVISDTVYQQITVSNSKHRVNKPKSRAAREEKKSPFVTSAKCIQLRELASTKKLIDSKELYNSSWPTTKRLNLARGKYIFGLLLRAVIA